MALISPLLLAGCEGQAPDAGVANGPIAEGPAPERLAAKRNGVSDLAAASLAANCYTCHLTTETQAGASALATTAATAQRTAGAAKLELAKGSAIPSLDGWQADAIRRALVRYQTEADGQGVMHRIARALDTEAIGVLAEFIATHPCAGLTAVCSEP